MNITLTDKDIAAVEKMAGMRGPAVSEFLRSKEVKPKPKAKAKKNAKVEGS